MPAGGSAGAEPGSQSSHAAGPLALVPVVPDRFRGVALVGRASASGAGTTEACAAEL